MVETLLKYVFLVLDMETAKLWQKVLIQYNIFCVCCYKTTWHLIMIIKHVTLSCSTPCSIDCSPETEIQFKKYLFTTLHCLIHQFHFQTLQLFTIFLPYCYVYLPFLHGHTFKWILLEALLFLHVCAEI